MKNDQDVTLIGNSRTKDLPDGDLQEAWNRLKHKYEPTDMLAKIEVQRKFDNCKLAEVSDVYEW